MKQIVTGIVAHVDAGKTTLTEALIYETGAIRKLGRVDNGDAYNEGALPRDMVPLRDGEKVGVIGCVYQVGGPEGSFRGMVCLTIGYGNIGDSFEYTLRGVQV